MKNYKIILFVLALITIGIIVAVRYIEMPVPHKVQIKLLDVNDDAVK